MTCSAAQLWNRPSFAGKTFIGHSVTGRLIHTLPSSGPGRPSRPFVPLWAAKLVCQIGGLLACDSLPVSRQCSGGGHAGATARASRSMMRAVAPLVASPASAATPLRQPGGRFNAPAPFIRTRPLPAFTRGDPAASPPAVRHRIDARRVRAGEAEPRAATRPPMQQQTPRPFPPPSLSVLEGKGA